MPTALANAAASIAAMLLAVMVGATITGTAEAGASMPKVAADTVPVISTGRIAGAMAVSSVLMSPSSAASRRPWSVRLA